MLSWENSGAVIVKANIVIYQFILAVFVCFVVDVIAVVFFFRSDKM